MSDQVFLAVPTGGSLMSGQQLLSGEIDFTAQGINVLIPPTPGVKFVRISPLILLTAKDGTVITAPKIKIGTNATNDNLFAAQSPAAFVNQAVDTALGLSSVSPPQTNLSIEEYGIRLEVVDAAILGTATVLKGRFEALISVLVY